MTTSQVPDYQAAGLDQQRVFRLVLEAMSRPGRLITVDAPEGSETTLNAATVAVARTLLDDSTPVWIDPGLADDTVLEFLRFYCGCPITTDPEEAAFAFAAGGVLVLDRFSVGDDEFPEASTTVVLQVERLTIGSDVVLAGPGIDGTVGIADPGLPTDFWTQWAVLAPLYPCGIDIILTAGDTLCGLPRTVRRVIGPPCPIDEGR